MSPPLLEFPGASAQRQACPNKLKDRGGCSSAGSTHHHRLPAAWGQVGFTLIEVLVALGMLASMALMAWRAVDGLMRTQAGSNTHHQEAERAQMAMLQWQLDLDAIQADARQPALAFDGNSMTLVRRDAVTPTAVRVVAWRVRDGQWSRWQSDRVNTDQSLERAWLQAQSWGQDQWRDPSKLDLLSASDWAIYYYRDNAWTNPLSAASTEAANTQPAQDALPTGIRLRLQRPGDSPFAGWSEWDWINPLWSPGS